MYSVLMPYPAKTDRESILVAAVTQLEAQGLSGLSIRSLAAALGLAPNALYRYFRDRAELEIAIGDEIAKMVHTALSSSVAGKPSGAAVRSIANEYLVFARDHRALYDMMMAPCPNPNDVTAAHHKLWQWVVEQVIPIAGPRRAPEAATALWAFLHGMAGLEAAGVLGEQKPRSSFDFGLDAWFEAASEGNPTAVRKESRS